MFDWMVSKANYNSAEDKLSCLRDAPFDKVNAAIQEERKFPLLAKFAVADGVYCWVLAFLLGYRSLQSTWTPRADGTFLSKSPHNVVDEGKIADVLIMIGDMKDEGTPFALVNSLNTATTEQFKDYFRRVWLPMATSDQIDCLAELYPNDPSAGSPFDTGNANAINPQYKRLAALIGDYSFESQRRQLLGRASGPKWTY
jgi:carboxylesterase type B